MAAALATLIGSSLKSFAKNQAKKKVANAGKNMLNRKANKPNENATNTTDNPNTNNKLKENRSTIAKPSTSLVPFKAINEKSSQQLQSSGDPLIDIQNRLIGIEKIVSINFRFKKVQEEKSRIRDEKGEFKERENKLERGLNIRGFNFPFSIPGKGLFNNIMSSLIRFIMFIALGKLFPTIINLLPTLRGILTTIGNIVGGIANIFGNLLDGLIGFATWVDGIKEKTKEIAKNVGGENLVDIIESFESTFNQFLNLALIAGMLTMSSSGSGPKNKPGSKSGRLPGGNPRNPKPSKAKTRYFKRFGKDRYIQRFGQEALDDLPRGVRRSAASRIGRRAITGTLGKGGTKTALKMMRKVISPTLKNIPIIGRLVNFALDVFVFKVHPGKAAFQAIGATLIGFLAGALGAIAGPPGVFVGSLLGGMAGDVLGGMLYDAIFSGKKPPKPKSGIQTKNRGGRVSATRGGKPVGGKVKRTIPKRKEIKKPNKLTIPLQPGRDVGGKEKIERLYNKEKGKYIFGLGRFKKEGYSYEVLTELSEIFKGIPFIGNWMGSAIDVALGQKPPDRLYKNYADNLGYFISNIVQQRVNSATSKVFGLISKLESGGTVASAGSNIRDIQAELNTKDISETIGMLVRNDMNKALQVVRDAANINIAKSSSDPAGQLPGSGGFPGGGSPGGGGSLGEDTPGNTTGSAGQWKPILELIAKAESVNGSYDSIYPSRTMKGLSSMTIAEADAWQARTASSRGSAAAGRYQFMRILEQARAAGLSPNDKFSPENQDKMAISLMTKKRKVSLELLKNNPNEAMRRLAPEWAGLPLPNGRSYYDGDGRNKATVSVLEFRSAIEKTNNYVPESNDNLIVEGGIKPSESGRRTSAYGMRYHPTLGGERMHKGVDYGFDVGTPISIIKPGVVVDIESGHAPGNRRAGGGYGNFVVVRHKDGTYSQYNHLSDVKVEKGDSVSGGKVIGTVGNTGQSSGPHLDFMVGSGWNGLTLTGIRNPESYADSMFRFGGEVKVKPSVAREFPAILNGEEGVYITDEEGNRTWKKQKWTSQQRRQIEKNTDGGRVIRSFKVGNTVYTEREGGVYTQNGKPIKKQIYDAVVKNHPQPTSPSPLSRPAQASPSRSPASSPSRGRGVSPSVVSSPTSTPSNRINTRGRSRKNPTRPKRMMGGGHIAPTQSKNYDVNKRASYEEQGLNNTKVVFVPIPISQTIPANNRNRASVPLSRMNFKPSPTEQTNSNPHFRQ